jgi:hypothetical protein
VIIQPEFIVISIHVVFSVFYIIFILSGRSGLRKEYIIPIILVPLFGPLTALAVELLIMSAEAGNTPLDIETDAFADDILWKTVKRFHEQGDIVPLEEAIMINDAKTRRKYMLETLYDDPLKYLDILLMAKNNDDVETSHYATTSISYLQRSFQLSIQKLAVEVEKNPDDLELLDDYIGTLANYIESGLLEEHLLRNMRLVYSNVLDRKLAKIKNDQAALIEKVRNSIALKEYVSAFEVSDLLRKHYPEDEESWIESIRVCVEGHDRNKLLETVTAMQNRKISWTKLGREQIAPWVTS